MGRRVAVAYANDEYGRGLVVPFLAALQANRVAPVESDPFLADTEDFRPYLRRMQARGVDLLFVAGLQDAAARVIDQAKEVGLAARVLGGDGVEGLVAMGPAYEGTVVGVLYHELASDSSRVFAARYRARYKEEPDSQAALAFDAVRLLARALREGHRDRESIRRYLEGVGRQGGSEPFPGAAGTVSFDANGDPMNKKLNVGEIRGGRIVPLRAAQ
jgi:branched-chain amino acid transport system substrate-binding protein